MKTKYILVLFILFASIEVKCQIVSTKNSEVIKATKWKAIGESRIYEVKLSEGNIEIKIEADTNKYSYKYPLYRKAGKQYFKSEDHEMCISIEQNILYINYCLYKLQLQEAVDEITTLAFRMEQ